MVKHIVLFKLKENIPIEQKQVVMHNFKDAIEALPASIPWIRKIEVGLNVNAKEKWDIALYSEFDSLEDMERYATHPKHLLASGLLSDVKDERACVDYQF